MDEAVIALIAALGAALLTAVGSLGVVSYQERLRGKSADADTLNATVNELLSRSFALAIRARTVGETAKLRSGLGEALDILTRQRKPIDPLNLHDWLEQDFGPLRSAWSDLWARGDQELVNAGNRLMSACVDVLTAATSRDPMPTAMSRKVRRLVRGDEWTPETAEHLESAERALAYARKELTLVARRKLGRALIDPFNRDESAIVRLLSPTNGSQQEAGTNS